MKTHTLFFLLLALTFFVGCVSKDYQTDARIAQLQDKLSQTEDLKIQNANKFIEQKIKFIEGIRDNPKIVMSDNVDIAKNKNEIEASVKLKIKKNGICTIFFQGEMSAKSEQAFYQVVKYALKNGCSDVLLKLNSNGGLVNVGVAIGLTTNKLGWNSLAWKTDESFQDCVSSCAIAFLGGRERYQWSRNFLSDDGFVFFHQISYVDKGKKLCITDPTNYSYTLINSYLRIVFPENPILMMGKILNEPCDSANYAISNNEILQKYLKSKYTNEVYEKYK